MASSSKPNSMFKKTSGSQSKLNKILRNNRIMHSTCDNKVIHKYALFSLFSNSDNQPTTELQSVMSKSDNLSATLLLKKDSININNLNL